MNLTVKIALASAYAAFTCSAYADLRDQLDLTIGVAELVVPNVQPNEAAEKVRSALAQFAIPTSLNYRAIGANVPARPGVLRQTQEIFRGKPVTVYHCDGSYAEVLKLPPPVQNSFAYIAEKTQACLYNFQGGIKAYLVFSRGVRTESLTSGLFKGITRAIQGSDDERIVKELQWGIDEIRKVMPQVLVERIDVPGRPVAEPDKDAVAKIIPNAVEAPVTVAMAAPVAASASLLNPQNAKIAARKDLTGMGLTFHSQEQFFQSIRRRDDVAVSLFLAGGGVDPAMTDASGLTALALAESIGAREIVALLKQPTSAGYTATIPAAATTTAAPASAPVPVSATSDAPIAIPAELKAQIDEQIESMNLPLGEKEVARATAYRNVQSVLRSVNNIKALASSQ